MKQKGIEDMAQAAVISEGMINMPKRQKILMCSPDHYGVNYVINPWMEGNQGAIGHDLAVRQWNNLREALEPYAEIVLVTPEPDLPDMVFTANAGMLIGDKVVISRFRDKERQGEEPFFATWFKDGGFTLEDWPEGISFEGAGDALLDRGKDLIWLGHGFRSSPETAAQLEKIYNRPVVHLKLVDPRFYHLDTCLCPLEGGYLMYYPKAFDADSLKRIEENVPTEKRIIVSDEDAQGFACNAVDLEGYIFLNCASEDLKERLKQAGFDTVITPLSEFMKAGGAAKCLTLKLYER